MYRDAKIDPPLRTEDLVKKRFDEETRGKPRRYKIDQMYRVKQLDKDYIVYNQTIFSEDFPGNERTCFETVGYHEEPRFQKRYNPETGQPEPESIQGTELVYDIPATKENMLKILKGPNIIPTNTSFVLQDANVKHGGFTMEEFTTKHYDDLMYKFNNGYYPRQLKPFGEGEEKGEKDGDNGEKREQLMKQIEKDLVIVEATKPRVAKPEQIVNEGEQPDEKEQQEQIKKEDKEAQEEEKEEEARGESQPRVSSDTTTTSKGFGRNTRKR